MANNNVNLQSNQSATIQGSSVTATNGALTVAAAGDVNIQESHQQSTHDLYEQTTSSHTLSSKTHTTHDVGSSDTAIGSTLSGNTVNVTSNNDINVRGSNVVSDAGTSLTAQNNVNITAAQNSSTENYFDQTKESGVFSGGGLGITIGKQQQTLNQNGNDAMTTASTVGSVSGDVTITANKNYQQTGSDIAAPTGNVNITAQNVTINPAQNTSQQSISEESKSSGVTVAVGSAVLSDLQTIKQMGQAATNVTDPRMQALALVSAGMSAQDAYARVNAGQGDANGQIKTGATNPDGTAATRDATAIDKIGGLNVSVSVGSSQSSGQMNANSSTAQGSNVSAGNDINITATNGDLTAQGATITAGNNVNLAASNNVNLQAAQSTSNQTSSNSSSSGSIGVSVGLTQGSPLTVNVAASKGSGNSDGNGVTYTNTEVTAGNKATLTSGQDTNLQGAVVQAPQVVANVGGNLNIQSLQDTNTYNSQQSSSGFSASVSMNPVSSAIQSVGGSVSAGNSTINSNYQSVTEQSGIRAGDNGFQVNVANNTTLTGGAITSTQAAVDNNKNSFTTGGTLAMTDLQNQANYSGQATGLTIGASYDMTTGKTNPSAPTPSLDGKLTPQGTSAGFGTASGSANSVTQSGISGIAGNKDLRTGDAQTGIAPIFDANKVQNDLNAQVQITQAFDRLASKAIGDYANTQMTKALALRASAQATSDPTQAAALNAEAQAIEDDWGDNGALRVLAHTVVGGLTGGASGAAGAAVSTFTVPLVSDALTKAGVDPTLTQVLTAAASAAIGSAVGGTAGASTAFNAEMNNRQLHENEKAKIKQLANGNSTLQQQLTDAACYLVHCAAGMSNSDPNKAVEQATEDKVAAGANGAYAYALGLLQANQAQGLFTYTAFDAALDKVDAADPRNQGTIDKKLIERNVSVINAPNVALSCTTSSCQQQALQTMQALDADLKATGVQVNDSERLGLSSSIAHLQSTLGNSSAVLQAVAMMANIVRGENAGQEPSAQALETVLEQNLKRTLTPEETAAVQNLAGSLQTVAYQKAQPQRISELTDLFNSNDSLDSLSLGGQTYATLNTNSSGTTKLMDTSNLSADQLTQQVFDYAMQLSGGQALKQVDAGVWTVKVNGTTINVRNDLASSSTAGRWTVDVQGKVVQQSSLPKYEIKFK